MMGGKGILTDRVPYRGYVLLPLRHTKKVLIYHNGEGIDTALTLEQAKQLVDRWMVAP